MFQYPAKTTGGIADRPPNSPISPDAVSTAAAPPVGAVDHCADFVLRGGHGDAEGLDSWCASYDGQPARGNLFHGVHLSDLPTDARLADAAAAMPGVGSEFCGFTLVAELGRGAFGRVFLSHQGDLADRPVALKVSTEIREESQRLARLQHTNIVPIYSFHRLGSLQAVCMPYFGSATLADVATELSRRQSLPASGKLVASTVYDRRSRTMRTVESRTAAAYAPAAQPVLCKDERPAPAPEASPPRELKRLEELTYVESILWIGARLADGLAHAHERGILHRDLKPANVLLTDDGQPMLLDFNLSEDREKPTDAAAAHIGGTFPYMAPEHLEAFGGTWRDVDARSDLYSLGVILFELLTGRAPFIRQSGSTDKVLRELIGERRKGAPAVSRYNRAVSPAAEAIIRKCLQPDPARRYQTARDLKEDLERQLAGLPLLHQREPSLAERAQKWFRRNRWRAAATLFAVLGAGLVLLTLNFMRRAEDAAALNRLTSFRRESGPAQLLLSARVIKEDEEEGQAAARRALNLYNLPQNPAWQSEALVRRLPEAERTKLANEVGQLLILTAAAAVSDGNASAEQKAEGLQLNLLAEQCFGEVQPRALWAQRAELVADPAEARRLRERAAQTPLLESWDHYLAARDLLRGGKICEAVSETREAVRLDPNSFAAWFLLGNCSQASGSTDAKLEATVHYRTCASLRPDCFAAYFNCGLTWLAITTNDAKDYVKYASSAEADFTRAIELRPKLAEAYLQRSLARARLEKYREALADANEALANGVPAARVYLMRSRLRQQLGDRAGAKQDLTEGLQQTPADCRGWIDRGKARLDRDDAQGALADFARAAECNPLSREAIHDQAYVLGEVLKRPRDAIRLIDRELELYPDQPVVLVSRGVYYAQLRQRDRARADARRAVTRSPCDGEVLYRAACVYALTSRLPDDPKGDRRQALGLLARALERGFGFEFVDTDADLGSLLDEPDFSQLRTLIDKTRKLKGSL